MTEVFYRSAKMYLVVRNMYTPLIRKRIIRYLEMVYTEPDQITRLQPYLDALKHPLRLISKKQGLELWDFISRECRNPFQLIKHDQLLVSEFYAPSPVPISARFPVDSPSYYVFDGQPNIPQHSPFIHG